MTFKLKVLPRAREDAQRIFDWLSERSPDGAVRWYAAFEDAMRRATLHPQAFGLAPEDEDVDFELRQFLFKTRRGRVYRGLFTIAGDAVCVHRVRGPGQPPLKADELSE